MKTPNLYLDTSVIGGYYDEEFMVATRKLFGDIKEGRYIAIVSSLTYRELLAAPYNVKSLVDNEEFSFQSIKFNDEAEALSEAYLKADVLGKKWEDDCSHVAMATVCGSDLLVSWNFKHIVQYEKIKAFNAVNLANGYQLIDIRSPLEVIYHEE